MEKITVPLGDVNCVTNLIVKASGDYNFREVYIGIETEEGDYIDLAVIGEKLTFDNQNNVIRFPGEFLIRLYNPEKNYKEKIFEIKVPELLPKV